MRDSDYWSIDYWFDAFWSIFNNDADEPILNLTGAASSAVDLTGCVADMIQLTGAESEHD